MPNTESQTTPAPTLHFVVVMLEHGGRFAAVPRLVKGEVKGFEFPGGKVEKDEAVEVAMVREVFEETGLRVCDPVQIDEFRWADRDDQYVTKRVRVTHLFRATLDPHTYPEGPPPMEHGARWMTPAELRETSLASRVLDRRLAIYAASL